MKMKGISMRQMNMIVKGFVIVSLTLIVGGCGPSHILEYNDHQYYVEYPKDQVVQIGDEFDVFEWKKKKVSRFAKPAPPQHHNVKVGRIIIVGIADTSHGIVRVLEGEVEQGFTVKKIERTEQIGQE